MEAGCSLPRHKSPLLHTLTHSVGPPTIPRQQVIVRLAAARKRQHRDGATAERHSHCDDGVRCPHAQTTTERALGPLHFKSGGCCIIHSDSRGWGAVSGSVSRGLFYSIMQILKVPILGLNLKRES